MKQLFLAVLVMMPLSCVGVYAALGPKRAEAVEGWRLQPIVVAAVDLDEGQPVAMENISQRSIPERFITDANVSPNDASLIIGRPLTFALNAGDPLLWRAVAPVDPATKLAQACVAALQPTVDAAGVAAREAHVKTVQALTGEVEALPPAGAPKLVAVTTDLAEGATLTASVLTTVDVPPDFASGAEVIAAERSLLEGAKLVTPLQKGDVVAWVHVGTPDGPQTVAGCAFDANAASERARQETAVREAKAWKPTTEEQP